MEPVYTPVIGAAKTLIAAMNWKIQIHGAEHIPASGPALLASNHIGYLDFVFIGYGALDRGRMVRFAAKKEVFDHKVSGPLMRGMRHIQVDRFGGADAAVVASVAAMRRGEVIGMFPEGTISRSFIPAAGKTGAARMAMDAQAPLIPTAVWGTQRILTKGRPKNFQRGVVIDVRYGEPVACQPGDDPTEVTKRLMDAITGLVENAAREYPQRPAGDGDRWWLPASMGGTAPTVEEAEAMAAAERAERRAKRQREG
ncbi:MAG TPA: lysophospholipid acyltransferase family protein [Egibacteraceae bacterium]|nr:lysophospholipid acyltransferase family protein [Egibacteraceae bacterium]